MIKNIVIAGGGSSGWMTAAYLATQLDGVDIRLIESSDIPIIGVGESTIPPMLKFMDALGFSEQEWMPRCNATYKSAICFKNFHALDDPVYWYAFEPMAEIAGRPFARYWLNRHLNDPKYADRFSFFDYCFVTPELCRNNKTLTSLSKVGPAYQVDAGLMGEMLREHAMAKGVDRIIDTITSVNRRENGDIASLSREQGPDLEADLFIDCTGFRSLLLQDAMGEPYQDFCDSLFNDRAVALRFPFRDKEEELVTYTLSEGVSSGWIWKIPLYNRMGSGYVYCSRYQSEEAAEAELRAFHGEERLQGVQARHLKFRVGRTARCWVRNCIGIGLSSGFVEPLESTALFTVQLQVESLARTLQGRNDYNAGDVAVYNRIHDDLYTGIRDFLIAHYVLTEREDTPYWRDVKYATRVPDSLADLLRLARLTLTDLPVIRQIYRPNFGDFSFTDGWLSILTGMNHLPLKFNQFQNVGPYEPQVVQNLALATQHRQGMEKFKREDLPKLPSHYQFLKDTIYGDQE